MRFFVHTFESRQIVQFLTQSLQSSLQYRSKHVTFTVSSILLAFFDRKSPHLPSFVRSFLSDYHLWAINNGQILRPEVWPEILLTYALKGKTTWYNALFALFFDASQFLEVWHLIWIVTLRETCKSLAIWSHTFSDRDSKLGQISTFIRDWALIRDWTAFQPRFWNLLWCLFNVWWSASESSLLNFCATWLRFFIFADHCFWTSKRQSMSWI